MDANEKIITLFSTRVRQLILQYQEVRKENTDLYAMLQDREARIKELEAALTQAHNNYEGLKMAKMLEVTDGEIDAAKKRLAKLIRDVNKCITLLSE